MPIASPEYRAIAVRCLLGPDRAAIAADTYTVHLFSGDPMGDGIELVDTTDGVPNGYAAATVNADDFAVDDTGVTDIATFPEPLAEWSHDATHYLMRDTVTGHDAFTAPLREPLIVTSAGAAPTVAVTVFFDEDVPGV